MAMLFKGFITFANEQKFINLVSEEHEGCENLATKNRSNCS